MSPNIGQAPSASSDQSVGDPPSVLVIVSNFPRPFRVFIDTRVAREIEGLTVNMFYYRAGRDYLSEVELPEDLHAVVLAGAGEKRPAHWWGRPFRDWRKAEPIICRLQKHDVCAVIMDGYASLLALRLLRYCRRRRIPIFVRGDSNIKNDRPRSAFHAWLKRRLVGWVVRHASGFMPMASCGQQYFQKYGARPEQCFWVPSVPDYDLFLNVPPEQVDSVREKFGLSADRKYLVYSGRFISVKRLDQLIEAFARIAADRPEWDLLMVGAGPLEEELKQAVPASLESRVKWLGFCPWDELRAIYHASHVLALTSTSEAWGLVIMEAMAAGMVVVASDIVAAADELVEEDVNGQRYRAGDLDGLVEALLKATEKEAYQRYCAAVPRALEDWRRRADPVEGVRKALASVDVLPGGEGAG